MDVFLSIRLSVIEGLKSFLTTSQSKFNEGETGNTMLWKKSRSRKIHRHNLVHDLLYATVSRDVKRVDELIQCGIDPCTRMEDGTSAIHKAAVMEPPFGPQIITRMLSYGADANVTTPTGLTPLHIAAMWGRVHTINVLLDFGADVLLKDKDDMSALDYADEAEENRVECIDALTRYRSTPRRKSSNGYFLTKSRFNLEKIVGTDISSSDKDSSFKICERTVEEKHDIVIEQKSMFVRERNKSLVKSKRKSLQKRLSLIRFPSINAVIQKDKNSKSKKSAKGFDIKNTKIENEIDTSFATYTEILDIDVPDGPQDRTLFHSCDEEINSFSREDSSLFITSTFIEDPSAFDSALSIQLNNSRGGSAPSSGKGSSISSENSSSSSDSSSSFNSSSSDPSSSGNSSSSIKSGSSPSLNKKSKKSSKKDKSKKSKKKSSKQKDKNSRKTSSSNNDCPVIDIPGSKSTPTGNDVNSLASRLSNIDLFKNFMAPRENETKMLIPISLPNGNTKNCNVNINICITSSDQESVSKKATKNTKKNIANKYDAKPKEVCEEIIPSPIKMETVDAVRLDDFIEKMDGSVESIGEEFISLNAPDLTFEGELMGEATIEMNLDPLNEPTIDYLNENKPVSNFANYFEGKNNDNKNQTTSLSTEEVTSTFTPDRLLNGPFCDVFSTPIGTDISAPLFGDEKCKKMQESGIDTGDNSSSASVDESTLIAMKSITESLIFNDKEKGATSPNKENKIEELCKEFKIDELCREYEVEELGNKNRVNVPQNEVNDKDNICMDDKKENIYPSIGDIKISSESIKNLKPKENYENATIPSQSKNNLNPIENYENVDVTGDNIKKSISSRASADSSSSNTNRKSIDDFAPKFVKEDSFVLHTPSKPNFTRSNAQPITSLENEKMFSITDMKKLIASQLSLGGGSNEKLMTFYDCKNPTPTYENAQTYNNNNQKRFRFTSLSDRSTSSRGNSKSSSESNISDYHDAKPIACEPIDPSLFRDKNVDINDTEKLYSLYGYSTLPIRNKNEKSAKDITSTGDSDLKSADSNDEILGGGIPNSVLKKKNEQRKNVRKSGIPILVQKAAKLASAQRNGEPLPERETVRSPQRVTINEKCEYFESSEYYEESSSEERMSTYEDSDGELLSFEELEKELGCSDEVDQAPRGISDITISYKPRGLMDELSEISVEYGWKDICQSDIVREFEHRYSIPSKILTLHDKELLSRLTKVGINTNCITDRTRRIYQKHLVKLENCEHVVPKPTERYEDYTLEMANVLCGLYDITTETGELLEKDMALQFEHPEKHTWREGTKPTSFNYILLDPRVTNDLPQRANKMSFLQAFKVFVASIYFVGRGRNCRPNEHLEEATKYVFRPPTNKIKVIHDIWASGLGVISIPVFENIIPVEAFTREACIIEALGTSRLTNVKYGDFYGAAASWSTKKQRILGIYLLMKAMKSFLRDGEKRIRIRDIDR